MNNINPEISIIIEDFNGECSKRYTFDTSDNTNTLTNLSVLKAIYLPALALFLRLILA